jgi:hypothetical protein
MMGDPKDKKKEIYTYEAPWPIYGMNWSSRLDKPYRLAMGSFLEDYTNRVDVIQLNEESEVFEVKVDIIVFCSFLFFYEEIIRFLYRLFTLTLCIIISF